MRALIFCLLILPLMACVAPPNPETAQAPVPATAAAAPLDAAAAPPDAATVGVPVVDIAPAATETPAKEIPAPSKNTDSVAASAPVADIAPEIIAPAAKPDAPAVVDASCKTDDDCTVKNVGSCCGYNPRCVNKDSPTFPEQVKAKCATQGRVGICGFPAIDACRCDQGKCAAIGSGVPVH